MKISKQNIKSGQLSATWRLRLVICLLSYTLSIASTKTSGMSAFACFKSLTSEFKGLFQFCGALPSLRANPIHEKALLGVKKSSRTMTERSHT